MFEWLSVSIVLPLLSGVTLLLGGSAGKIVETIKRALERVKESRDRTRATSTAGTRTDPPGRVVVYCDLPDVEILTTSEERSVPEGDPRSGPEFIFRLGGDRARGDLVQTQTAVNLHFEYRAPSDTDLAVTRGKDLSNAAATDADLEVAIVPRSFTVTDGSYLKIARFRKGALSNEVVFKMQAEGPSDRAGVHVFFSVKGCVLYDFPLTIRIVENLETATRADLTHHVRAFDLDQITLAQAQRTQRQLRLIFRKDGGRIGVLLQEFGQPDLELPLRHIDTATWSNLLKKAASEARSIADQAFWNRIAKPLEGAADSATQANLSKALDRLISAGSSLHREMVTDKNLAWVLKRIDDLATGSHISVLSNCGFLPLEIVYPLDYHFTHGTTRVASRLWGYRFHFEHLIWDEDTSHHEPSATKQQGLPFVSLNLDPWIDTDVTKVGQNPPFLPVHEHDGLVSKPSLAGWRTEINREFEAISATFKAPHEATMLYYYCHGKSDTPLTGSVAAKLRFGSEFVDPDWIQTAKTFANAPVIVLNSCDSGEASPLSLLTFLEAFRRKGASGAVCTWFSVPMLFASAFGRELITRYSTSEPIGEILYDLRRRLLDHDNPLGLFYALQCPMDLTAPEAATRKAA